MMSRRWFACFALLGVFHIHAENIVFPADAGVYDVRRDGGAKGDGVADDTAALQAAVARNGRLVYLPNGTYLISDRLPFAAGDRRSHRIILQGQSTTGTVIRLRDHAPLFRDPANPRALVNTGRAPAQRFRHSLRNLTFDTGTGNPGAIGVQYFANNQGTMSHVVIRSGDGAGAIGLDLGYTNEQGPCLIEQVSVEGFDVGIALKHGVNSVTMEHVRLAGQRLAGIRNDGQPLWIRGLVSSNDCPALDNAGRGGLVTLVDASLQGHGKAEHLAAIVSAAHIFLRDVVTSGYARLLHAATSFDVALPSADSVGEWVSHPVFRLTPGSEGSLRLPVKETPDVPWDVPATWRSVARFAPTRLDYKDLKGRTRTAEDWTDAFQRAIDSGATTVYFPKDREYGLFGEVRVRGNVRRIIAMEAVFRTPAGAPRGRIVVDDGASEVVVLERFDPLYASIELIHAAPRTLVYRNSCGMNLQTRPGAGDLFLVDVAPEHPWPDRGDIPAILRIDHSAVWARQFNPEGNQGLKILNQGGTLWALGVKTEGDSTCLKTTAGGRSEVLGAFIYANSGRPKQPLFVTEDADLTVTYCESVLRAASFTNVLVEVRGGTTNILATNKLLRRGGGGMAPLLVSRQATTSACPPLADASAGPATSTRVGSSRFSGLIPTSQLHPTGDPPITP